jgi:hypothetical protein
VIVAYLSSKFSMDSIEQKGTKRGGGGDSTVADYPILQICDSSPACARTTTTGQGRITMTGQGFGPSQASLYEPPVRALLVQQKQQEQEKQKETDAVSKKGTRMTLVQSFSTVSHGTNSTFSCLTFLFISDISTIVHSNDNGKRCSDDQKASTHLQDDKEYSDDAMEPGTTAKSRIGDGKHPLGGDSCSEQATKRTKRVNKENERPIESDAVPDAEPVLLASDQAPTTKITWKKEDYDLREPPSCSCCEGTKGRNDK